MTFWNKVSFTVKSLTSYINHDINFNMSLNCQLTFVLNLHDQISSRPRGFYLVSFQKAKWNEKKNYKKKIRNENEQYENKMNINWKQKEQKTKNKTKIKENKQKVK